MSTAPPDRDPLAEVRRSLDRLALALASPAWLFRLSLEDRKRSRALADQVQGLRLEVANAQLAAIVERLRAGEAELADATTGMNGALEGVRKAAEVFVVADRFLGVVTRIVRLVA